MNILSDSRSSLELLRRRNCCHPLSFEIKNNLRKVLAQEKTVRMFWIRAHVGASGNERADELAKQAALYRKTAADYNKCPTSHVKWVLREKTKQEWSLRYAQGETANVTRYFLPDAVRAYRLIRNIKLTPVLVQLLTGHGGFPQYLHRFKCEDSPACICDPEKEESVLHLLLDCPKHELSRFDFEMAIDRKLSETALG